MMFRHPLVLREVVVNLKSGTAIRGVIVQVSRGYLVMRNSSLVNVNQPVPMDGAVYVAQADVDFVQALGVAG